MSFKKTLRNLIVGKERYIALRSDFKTTLLRGQLALLGFVAGTVYIIRDITNEMYPNIPVYLVFVGIMIISFFTNKSYDLAR